MFKSYWTMAWRVLVRHRVYTLVNVLGLTMGLCACMVIWVIAHYEFSFDRDHPDGSRIYQINSYEQFLRDEPELRTSGVLPAFTAAVRQEVPGIETVAPYHILHQATAAVMGEGKQTVYPAAPIVTGPDYFRVLRYDWLEGDGETSLTNPFRVVLSERKARQYFGSGPLSGMIGRPIVYDDSLTVFVSGIVRDWTQHTDFSFEEFISLSTAPHSWLWQSLWLDPNLPAKGIPYGSCALVKLDAQADPGRVNSAMLALFKSRKWPGPVTRVGLQPLSAVHFTSDNNDGTIRTSQLSTLYALLGIAAFILALAIINYVNLSTAQSLTREKEIGIRKIMGSGRGKLMIQLLVETFLLTAFAALLAVLLVRPVLGTFRQFIPADLLFQPFAPANLLFLMGATVVTTLLAGIYPARLLSGHSPVEGLKGAGAARHSGKWLLRKGLIVFQFTVSLLFIIGSLITGKQIGYMLHTDLGFRSDAIVDFNTDERSDSVWKVKQLEAAIGRLPGITAVARENMPPAGRDRGIWGVQYAPMGDQRVPVEGIKADEHYIGLYGIRLLAGRNLLPSDTIKEVLINESLLHLLGFRDPDQAIGITINARGKNAEIVGVVADFHKYSYREAIKPLLIAGMACSDIVFRMDTKGKSAGAVHNILSRVEKVWKTFYPNRPFEYSFFDTEIAELYKREQTMEWLMEIATGVTLFISCIGLFGLSLFLTERRTREIGIRKVMGAGVGDILTLLGKDFVLLVGVALVIASAAGWWWMHRWLEGFAYRVTIGVDIFLLSGGALLGLTVLTVGMQALRAALANPVKALRSE